MFQIRREYKKHGQVKLPFFLFSSLLLFILSNSILRHYIQTHVTLAKKRCNLGAGDF